MVLPLLFFLGFLIRMVIAATIWGTWDMESIYLIADMLKKGIPVYMATWRYNQPPVWMWMIGGLANLENLTGIPLHFLAKLPFIASDLGIAYLIMQFSRIFPPSLKLRGTGNYSIKTGIYLTAFYLFSPIAIFISAYQGQLDPLMCFLILLSAYLLLRKNKITTRSLIFSALILGVAGTIKLVPLGVAPVFSIFLLKKFLQIKMPWQKIVLSLLVFNLLVVLPVILVFIPYLSQWEGIKKDVIGYKTAWGIWGSSLLLRRVTEIPNLPQIVYSLADFSKSQSIIIAAVVSFAYLVIFFGKYSLLESIFIVFLTVTAFSSYLAPQYLVWIVPFWVILRKNLKLFLFYNLFVVVGLFFLFVEWSDAGFYTYWGSVLGINDRVLSINLLTIPMMSGWGVTLMMWLKMLKLRAVRK